MSIDKVKQALDASDNPKALARQIETEIDSRFKNAFNILTVVNCENVLEVLSDYL